MVALVPEFGTPPDQLVAVFQLPPPVLLHSEPPAGVTSVTSVPPRLSLVTMNRVLEATPARISGSTVPPLPLTDSVVPSNVAEFDAVHDSALRYIVSPGTKPEIV